MYRFLPALLLSILLTSCDKEEYRYIRGYGPGINLPSAFTPNGDGVNDTFSPIFDFGIVVDEYHMKIFTSEYQEIFSTTDTSDAWTGKNPNGSTQAAGSYFCRVYGTYDTGGAYDVSSRVELIIP